MGDPWQSCELTLDSVDVAGRSGLHVQPYRRDRSSNHAQGVCDSRVAGQPCSPHVPGLYEVGCGYVSSGDGGCSVQEH